MSLNPLLRTQSAPVLAPTGRPSLPPAPAAPRLSPLRRDALALAPVAVNAQLPARSTTLQAMPQGTRGALEIVARGGIRVSQGNQVALHVNGDRAMPALVELIRSAKHTLYLETMIWHNDETGQMIANELAAARQRGVDVRVLVDAVGQRFGEGRHNDPQILAWLRARGVQAYTYNPTIVGPQGVSITHHKLYIADNERFLSGGMNIGNEYAHDWHDMLFQVEGPAAREVAGEFAVNWRKRTGETIAIPPAPAVPAAANPSPGTAAVGIAVTDPDGQRFQLRQVTLNMIRSARHSIRVQMPYNSDDDFMQALKDAARRGVNVEFIMPGANNDTLAYAYLNANEARDLTAAGVHVRFYGEQGSVNSNRFSHLKMIMIDDTVAAVGSGNGDARTFRDNNELNAYIADPGFIQAMHHDIWDRDWAESAPVSTESINRRPLWQRAAGAFFERVDRLM